MIKGRASALLFRHFMCAIISMTLLLSFVACGGSGGEPLRAPDGSKINTISIETVYGTLAFSKELQANLRHQEVTEDRIAMEVFYMVSDEAEKELFRIYFGDAQQGTFVGYLITEGVEVPVSYSICEYTDDSFRDEEERELYNIMMDSFSVVISSLYANENFSESGIVDPVENQKVKLRYWTVQLPENVLFEETDDGDNYRIDFYGMVEGERVDLYMIGLGDIEAETNLGLYKVKGVEKSVVIQTYDMDAYAIWSKESQDTINQMMSSLNTVVQVIVSDKNYSEMENEQ